MGLIRFLYHNKTFILLCFFVYLILWLTIGIFKQSTDSKNFSTTVNKLKFRSNSTFSFILNNLFQLKLNLLLIDPYVLDYLFIHQLSFENLDKQIITFGIQNSSFQSIIEYFSKEPFSIKISKNLSINHLFIEYQQKIIHLATLHPRFTYYLIEKNTHIDFDDIQLSYGDTLRIVEQ